MRTALFALAAMAFQGVGGRAVDPHVSTHLIDPGASETAAVVDIDRDGRLDIVSGAYWYHAPHWTRYQFRDVGFSNNYIDSFSLLPVDVDGDGYMDLADVSWFAKRIAWWRNPGRAWGPSRWQDFTVNACCNVEFAVLADMNNDGQAREIVAQENGTGQAWYEVKDGGWVRHTVSDKTYGHGIGAGDVNADGRTDILTPGGWLEAPADPRSAAWPLHRAWGDANLPILPAGQPGAPAATGAAGAAPSEARRVQLGFMHVVDVNGDGRNDVVTAAGHDYGVFWFEQGESGWTRYVIDNAWSQGHASTLADLNGDGRPEFITGKRFMAHNGADPGEREPLGLYWYEWRTTPSAKGLRVEWIRHTIDYGGRVGTGMQIVTEDLDDDGDRDIVMGGKSGLFWIENRSRR
jgi:hypothetical protein